MVTNNAANNKTGASGTVLQGQGVGTTSDFSTATFPSTATGTGKVLIADGTNWVASTPTYPNAAGTSGNLLTSNGTNFVSSSPAGLGASMVLLSSQAASNSASITFNSTFITSTYNNYFLLCSGVVSVNNGANMRMQVSVDNGSNYIATGYSSGITECAFNGTTFGNTNSTSAFVLINTMDNTSTAGGSCAVYIYNARNSIDVMIGGTTTQINGGNAGLSVMGGAVTTVNINNIKILMSSGNISTGTFTLYGIRES